ncbi:MAG: hypothetical protein GC150_08825 [Rhizobiales bacterium]|nr:hypothetical protein [Hyphomicrobiales bacterium]
MFTWDAAGLLGVLGNPLRLRIVGQLAPLAGDSITLSRLAARLGEPTDRIRAAVTPLQEVGLVLVERTGRATRYRTDDALLAALLEYLARRLAPVEPAGRPKSQPARRRPRSLVAALSEPDATASRVTTTGAATVAATLSSSNEGTVPERVRIRARSRPHLAGKPSLEPSAAASHISDGSGKAVASTARVNTLVASKSGREPTLPANVSARRRERRPSPEGTVVGAGLT